LKRASSIYAVIESGDGQKDTCSSLVASNGS